MPASDLLAQRLILLQSFKEVTWGTGAAATAKWMGVEPFPTFKPYRASTVFDEARGSLAPGFLSAILRKGGEFNFNGMVTYEDIILPLEGFMGVVAPTGVGPYVYTFPGPGTTQPTLQSYAFEFSQSGSFVKATGSIINKLKISGEASDVLKYELSGFCQDVDTAAAGDPAALSDRAVEVALMPTTSVYLDAAGGTIGTTVFAGTLTDFSLELENSTTPIYTAGSLTPLHWVFGDKFVSSLSLGLLWTSTVRTFVNSTLNAGTGALIRLKSLSGTKVFQADFAGVLGDDYELFGDKDGAQMVSLKLNGRYDSAAALHTSLMATNGVAAVP